MLHLRCSLLWWARQRLFFFKQSVIFKNGNTSPYFPTYIPCDDLRSAIWDKTQTPNLGLRDPASATFSLPCSQCPIIHDTPATLAVLLFLPYAELVSASDLHPSSLYLEGLPLDLLLDGSFLIIQIAVQMSVLQRSYPNTTTKFTTWIPADRIYIYLSCPFAGQFGDSDQNNKCIFLLAQ